MDKYDEKIGKFESESWSLLEKLSTFCDTPMETHIFIDGVYTGFVEWRGVMRLELPLEEKHYFQSGFILGVIAKIVVILFMGKELIPMFFG